MPSLPLNKSVIERLILERFGGSQADFLRRAGIHKSTLGHWLKGENQPRPERFLKMCAALDVDFFATLEVSEGQIAALVPEIVQAVMAGDWRALPTFAFLGKFLLAPGGWPKEQLLKHYRPFSRSGTRTWHWHDFEHDPAAGKQDYYGTFRLRFTADPQVWWIAFRERLGIPWMWYRYGCFRKCWEEVLLMNFVFMGETQCYIHPEGVDSVVVQTYLGNRPTTYRIASLHPFKMEVLEGTPAGEDFVQFRQTGPT